MMWWYWAIFIRAMDEYSAHGFKAALYSHFLIMYLFWYLIVVTLVMLVTAVVTLYESKLLADIQSSSGPAKPGYLGLLQPIADAFKLIIKENMKPSDSYEFVYMMVALFSFLIAAFFWTMPTLSFENPAFCSEWTVMLAFLISMMHVFTILFAGWSSNSSYSFLGAMSTSAQLVAYDIVVVLVYLNMFLYTSELSFENMLESQFSKSFIVFLPAQFLVFFMALLAETSSHPFDLPEAESELVAGYNVEYSSISFAMFFLAEYSMVIYSGMVMNVLFFGGPVFSIRYLEFFFWLFFISVMIYFFVKASGLLPSYSYDQLMELGWKVLIPFECMAMMFNMFVFSTGVV